MATFSKATFNYAAYATSRPSYPASLFNLILAYHRGARDHLVDLGCGHGVATRTLAPSFTRTTATDPSDGMLAAARSLNTDPSIAWCHGTASSLPMLADASVDVAIAAQAAHWFPYPPARPSVWDELARVLKTGGTLAFWGYADITFVKYPHANEVVNEWAYRNPRGKGLGPCWTFPGREIVEGVYGGMKPAEGDFGDARWIRSDPRVGKEWYRDEEERTSKRNAGLPVGTDDDTEAIRLTKTMDINHIKAFIRTWSAYDSWKERYPDDVRRSEGGKGDVADWIIDDIAETSPEWRDESTEILVEWPVGMVLARRRQT